jgi:GNAT superfamily N-acetyltransferase
MDHKHTIPLEIFPATKEEVEIIHNKIDVFNDTELSFTGKNSQIEKNYLIKDGNAIIAGITSCFYVEEVLYVSVLFVVEAHRHKGLGSALLKHVEDEVKTLGARLAHLDTFDFQALDFYLKQGYEVFGVLEDCPKKGHKRYYLKKSL